MKKKKELIIEDKLNFLVLDYGMTYRREKYQGRTLYVFQNQFGEFIYWEWAQFSEDGFEIRIEDKKVDVNILDEYPFIYNRYLESHKGIKWAFKDTQEDYWGMIASIIKQYIESKGNLFGLDL